MKHTVKTKSISVPASAGPVRNRFDLAIIGGGIQGVLTLREAQASGLKALCITGEQGVGGRQTLASQRYLHAGSFYLKEDLIERFTQAREYWKELEASASLSVIYGCSYTAFSKLEDSEKWTEVWKRAGVAHEAVAVPKGHPLEGGGLRQVFRMQDEGWLNEVNPAARLAEGFEDCFLLGSAHNIRNIGGRFQVLVGNDRDVELVEADQIVLAAGAGNGALLQGLGIPSVRMQLRRCQVVSLEGDIPKLSLLCPGDQHFCVPERDPAGGWRWKSTFAVDPAVEPGDDHIDPERLEQHLKTLEELVPQVFSGVKRVTAHAVVKAESAKIGEGARPNSYFLDEAAPGLHVVWPTKLTLAPVAARAIVEAITEKGVSK